MKLYVPAYSADELAPLLADNLEPSQREWNRIIRFLLQLLPGIAGKEATPSGLAWLVLWDRAWQIVTIARQAAAETQRFLLIILHRAAIELDLHGHLLLEPSLGFHNLKASTSIRVKVSKQAEARSKREVLHRLVGFAAWCIDQDRAHLDGVRTNLRHVYNGEDARALARDPKARGLHEALYGPLDLENQHELDRQREMQQASIDRQLSWLSSLSDTPEVAAWLTEFRRIRAREQKTSISVFKLLGAEADSVRKRLAERDVGFVYGQYSHASQLLHGSSLLHFLKRSENEISPDFGAAVGNEQALSSGIAGPIIRTVFNLHFLKTIVWPDLAA